jgi:hypothetical protein
MSGGVSNALVVCRFCGQRKPQAKEDIISEWIAREIGPAGTNEDGTDGQYILELYSAADGNPPRFHKSQRRGKWASVYKLPGICADCNNGWMSDIEDRTQDLLLPLMRNEPRMLAEAECRTIARWSYLKAITLDAWYRSDPWLDPDAYSTFHEQREAPGSTTVGLGIVKPWADGRHAPVSRKRGAIRQIDGSPLTVRRYTFVFRWLILQVVIPEDGVTVPYSPPAGWFVNIWPQFFVSDPEPTYPWPPTLIDPARLAQLM